MTSDVMTQHNGVRQHRSASAPTELDAHNDGHE
jgi:hypothetical protein